MAALFLLILAAVGLGYGLGWLARSAGRRVITLESRDVIEESKPEATKDTVANPNGEHGRR
jgi:hypothetical protein